MTNTKQKKMIKLNQYTQNLENCNDKNPSPKKYKETTQKIREHPNIKSLETRLLPSMNSLLAFTESPISFTNYSFEEFLKIENKYAQSELTTRQLENFFITEYAKELNKAKNILYQNTKTITEQITEHLNNLGTKEQHKEKLQEIQENLKRNEINCTQFSWIKKFPLTNDSLIFCKQDYERHTKTAHQKTRNYLEIIETENKIDEKIYAALSQDEKMFTKAYF